MVCYHLPYSVLQPTHNHTPADPIHQTPLYSQPKVYTLCTPLHPGVYGSNADKHWACTPLHPLSKNFYDEQSKVKNFQTQIFHRQRTAGDFSSAVLLIKKAASYSPALHCSTIGAGGLNFSVRNGKRWDTAAITTQNVW